MHRKNNSVAIIRPLLPARGLRSLDQQTFGRSLNLSQSIYSTVLPVVGAHYQLEIQLIICVFFLLLFVETPSRAILSLIMANYFAGVNQGIY